VAQPSVGKRFSKPQVDFVVDGKPIALSWEKVLKTPSRLQRPSIMSPPKLGKGSQNPK